MAARKVIIDTDAGLDDALALFMALEAHRRGLLQVLAITTVNGNTAVQNVNNNVIRILRMTGLTEIPVYSGCSHPLVHPWKNPDHPPCHGNDGFGDAELPPQPPASTFLQPQHATLALLDLVTQHPGEIFLVALGPLTNVALAIRLDPAFTSGLAAFYAMGGNTTGRGNITACGEFNFTCDPEAALVVLEGTRIPVRLIPWEICFLKAATPYSLREELGQVKTATAELMNTIEGQNKAARVHKTWVTCDQLAMAWVIDDVRKKRLETDPEWEKDSSSFLVKERASLVTATRECLATVEVTGSLTRGQMVIDHNGRLDRQRSLLHRNNLVLLEGVNMSLYRHYLSMAFGVDV